MRPPKYLGVYSLVSVKADGPRKTLFFVWELASRDHAPQDYAPQDYAVQQLSKALQPVSAPERVTAAYFAGHFSAEPSILAMPVTTLDSRLLADRPEPDIPAPRPGVFDLEDARLRALDAARKTKQVEASLRESFRKTLLRLKRPRERQAAINALEQLASSRENIAPSHKHMFRDFGIKLRKNSLPELALLFGKRVLELAPEDDHAHFNLARILCALGLYDEAAEHIRTAIRLDAGETLYPRMLAYISKEKQLRPGKSRPKRTR